MRGRKEEVKTENKYKKTQPKNTGPGEEEQDKWGEREMGRK